MAGYVETDRDRWAEVEARQCIKVAEALESNVAGWLAGGNHAESFHRAEICMIKATTWREMADSLRRPAAIGRERAELADPD